MKIDLDEVAIRSGTTATVCLLRNSVELVIGHVGDSRAVLYREGVIRKLTIDHTEDIESEKERILKAGGIFKTDTTGRGLVNGRLAMTRSIGDLELKPYGVIAEPETKSLGVKHAKDGFVSLTSDGVNNVISSDELGRLVASSSMPEEAASLLTDLAMQYGSDDNATALVLPFGAWGKYKPGCNVGIRSAFGGNLTWTYRS